ncbi:related to Sensitivity to high expression protein 10 [Zygosaccharomyces bailii]|nr:related to Sensitivity to high expression protein 10 [Zygosaccharomyces bailii]
MRILAKISFLLVTLTWSLHFYCQSNQCSAELQRVCHYTSPSVWEKHLVEKNQFYREQLSPKVAIVKSRVTSLQSQYKAKVLPKLVEFGNYFYLEIVSPSIEVACQTWDEFDHRAFRECSLKKLRWARQRIWYYYSVFVRPNCSKFVSASKLDKLNEIIWAHFGKLDQQYKLMEKCSEAHAKIAPVLAQASQRLEKFYHLILIRLQPVVQRFKHNSCNKLDPVLADMWERCRTSETCFKTHSWLKKTWQNLKFGLTYIKIYFKDAMAPYTEEIESVVAAKVNSGTKAASKSISKVKSKAKARVSASASARGNAKAEAKAGAKGITSVSASASADSTTSFSTTFAISCDEEDEEILSTTTSTVMLTVTMDDSELAPKETGAELEVAEQDVAQDEFDAWFRVVDQKSSSVVKSFDTEVSKYIHKHVQEIEPYFKNKTQNVSQTMQNHFKLINSAIQDINCTCETDNETGNVTCFDSTGTTQLSEYISRPRMRELFADAHSVMDKYMLQIKEELAAEAEAVDKKVQLIREELLEVYEEWGDVMISEWSKRLAYIDIVAGHLEEKDQGSSDASSDNWRKFLSLKKQVINARDQLATHPANLHEMKQFLKKGQYLVDVLSHESGEYLYILRARANLAFQAREKEEQRTEDIPRMLNSSISSQGNSSALRQHQHYKNLTKHASKKLEKAAGKRYSNETGSTQKLSNVETSLESSIEAVQ